MLQDLVSRCTEVKSHRCEANIVKFSPLSGEGLRERGNLEGRKIGWYEYRLFSVTHHILPFLGKDNRMGNNQNPPQPSLIREGVTCHCEGATHVDMLDNSCQFPPYHCEGVKRQW